MGSTVFRRHSAMEKKAQGLRWTKKTLERYMNRGLDLNVDQSQMVVFVKRRGRNEKEKWKLNKREGRFGHGYERRIMVFDT